MTDLHPLVQLAKETIENYVRHGKTIQAPEELRAEKKERAGTLVSPLSTILQSHWIVTPSREDH